MSLSPSCAFRHALRSGRAFGVLASLVLLVGCSSEGDPNPGGGQAGQQSGGGSGAGSGAAGGGSGGSHASGGSSGGMVATAGMNGGGGSPAGGMSSTGGQNHGGTSSGGGTQQGGAGAGGSSGMAGASGSGGGGAVMSDGCKKMPTLKNSTSNQNPTPITISVGGTNREYAIRWPSNYDSNHPYRLILDLHGYGGSYKETAGEDFFGLWTPSNNTTIFVALSAISTDWSKGDNNAYVQAVLKAVEGDLCIDTSRIMLEGFSQGAAEAWALACSMPGVFKAMVGHSGGGVTIPSTCMPIPYLGSGGLQEDGRSTQETQTDRFAKWNGCTVSTLPTAQPMGHLCSDYMGCPATAPVRWCSFDGPHTPLPTDGGQRSSWMPSETWPFFSKW